MRVFEDGDGREWEVLVGRESWGTVVAIFVPRDGSGSPRQTLLEVTSSDEGNRALQGKTQEELQALLQSAAPKPMG